MNDSLRTDVFVRFQPESIACACIYLAARTLEVSVPLGRVPAGRNVCAVLLTVPIGAKKKLLLDQHTCFYCRANEDKYDIDGICVCRSLCPVVPIGFFCLEQLKKKSKKYA